MRLNHPVGWAMLLLTSCGSTQTVPAAATRSLGVPASALAATPICFARPNPAMGLAEQADYGRLVSACQSAAARQNVRVQMPEAGGCLVATMALSSSDTGSSLTNCERDLLSPGLLASRTCETNTVFLKSLRLILAEPGKSTAADTTASIKSMTAGFTEQSYAALCSAAFYAYPRQVSTKFSLNVE